MEQLTDKLQSPYNPSSKQTMSQYIDMFQDTMERHDTLSTDPYSDIGKKLLLLRNLRTVPGTVHLTQHCRNSQDMSYEDTATYLRSNSILIDSWTKPSRRNPISTMLRASVDQEALDYAGGEIDTKSTLNLVDTISLINKMSQESSFVHVYQVLSTSPTIRDGLSIHPDIWNRLEPDMKTKIMEIRTEVRDKKQKRNGSQKGKNTNQKVVPKPLW